MKIEIVPQTRGNGEWCKELKVGRWYVDNINKGHKFCVTDIKDDKYTYYGTALYGDWRDEDRYKISPQTFKYRELTKAEIQEVLIEEAKKRWPNLPAYIKYLDGEERKLEGYGLSWREKQGALFASSDKNIVFMNGQWAKNKKS